MKNVILSAVVVGLTLPSSTSAFAPPSTSTSTSTSTPTALNVASTPRDFRKKDDWSNKPLYEPKSTTPVAHHKVTKRELAKMSNVVISPDYTLTWAVALLGPLIMWYHPCKSLKHLSAWSLASVHDLVLHLWWCRVVSDF